MQNKDTMRGVPPPSMIVTLNSESQKAVTTITEREHFAQTHSTLIKKTLDQGFTWMKFDAPLEKKFQEDFRENAIKRTRPTAAIGFVLFAAFGFLSLWVPQPLKDAVFWVHFGIVAPLLALIVIMTFIGNFVRWSLLCVIGGSFIIAGMLAAMINLLPPPYSYLYHLGFLPLSVFIFSMVKMSFRGATTVGAIIFGIHFLSSLFRPYLPTSIIWQPYDQPIVLIFCFFHIVINIMGMSFSYRMEYDFRKDFLKSYLLKWETGELKRVSEQLRLLSTLDPLTQLANRRQLEQCLETEWHRASKNNEPLALMLLDVDYFKNYNDGYGHQAGDECLIQISKILKQRTQNVGELAARYGGEEFILMFPKVGGEALDKMAETLRLQIEELAVTHDYSRVSGVVTVSIGATSLIPSRHVKPQDILKVIDKLLYEAKRCGRNCIKVEDWQPASLTRSSSVSV